jgi:predicted methyltransferase
MRSRVPGRSTALRATSLRSLKNGFVLAGIAQINANPNDDETLNA